MNKLELKSINEILSEKFYVPAYQRGYRWSDVQVRALLDDVWEFRKTSSNHENEFYCLQPVVVKEKNIDGISQWEVIDGQQRLTTLFIILNNININEYIKPKKLFTLTYQTRNNCNEFFKDIENTELAEKNIDFFHINRAHEIIDKWFTEKENQNDSIRHDFRSKLVKDVKIIWYETKSNLDVDEESVSIDIFTRLNIGKIPLTNAELIKALFLQKGNFSEEKAILKQLQIASEWDIIERKLQDDAFWFFIYNTDNPLEYENRIEYMFDLMQGKKKEHENYYTFYKFYNEFIKSTNQNNGSPNIDNLWSTIKKYFLSFEEWYNDKELYHLIGYLIEFDENIKELKGESVRRTKKDFKKYLKSKIKEKVNCQLDELSYKGNCIKEVFLLFNIQTILSTENTDIRFPFFRYKNENWDIEHIRSQTDKQVTRINRKEWIIDVLEYFTGLRSCNTEEEIQAQEKEIFKLSKGKKDKTKSEQELAEGLLKLICADKIQEEEFNKVYEEIASYFEENNDFEDKDGIGNLTLLDSRTNRSYGNAMFPIKRKIIIQNDMNGVFVPLCTKNVFLKSYTKKLGDVMYWTDKDAEDYREAIKYTLKDYLPPQEVANE